MKFKWIAIYVLFLMPIFFANVAQSPHNQSIPSKSSSCKCYTYSDNRPHVGEAIDPLAEEVSKPVIHKVAFQRKGEGSKGIIKIKVTLTFGSKGWYTILLHCKRPGHSFAFGLQPTRFWGCGLKETITFEASSAYLNAFLEKQKGLVKLPYILSAQIVQLHGRGSNWSVPTGKTFPWPVLDDRSRVRLALELIQSKHNEAKIIGTRKLNLLSPDEPGIRTVEIQNYLIGVDSCYSESQRISNGPFPTSYNANYLEEIVQNMEYFRSRIIEF